MKRRKSRLALLGMLALATSVTVGLVSGSIADAKKKGKGGGKGASVTIAAGPTAVPPSAAPGPAGCEQPPAFPPCTVPGNQGIAAVPMTVGGKGKNKVVSLDSVAVSFSITGSPRTNAGAPGDTAASASNVRLSLTAPNGRTVGVFNPGFGDQNATTIGPVTATPNSPFDVCSTSFTGTNGETTICSFNDPDDVIKPPTYAGTIGDVGLAFLGGVPAKGVWTAKFRNDGLTPATVSSFSAAIGLTPAPTSSGGGGGGKKK
jgi:hypothetical protein